MLTKTLCPNSKCDGMFEIKEKGNYMLCWVVAGVAEEHNDSVQRKIKKKYIFDMLNRIIWIIFEFLVELSSS